MSLILVAAPDGAVTYIDRGLWLTLPFGMSWRVADLRAYLALSDAAATRLALSDAPVTTLALGDTSATLLTLADIGDPHG